MRTAEVLPALSSIRWGELGVCHAILFGSLAKHGEGNDVDLLISWCGRRGDLVEVAVAVSEALGADPSVADLVELDKAPCPIIHDALSGVFVYTVNRSEAIDLLMRKAEICWDWQITMRKLRLVEDAIQAAKERWG